MPAMSGGGGVRDPVKRMRKAGLERVFERLVSRNNHLMMLDQDVRDDRVTTELCLLRLKMSPLGIA